jgi:WD40 repeat protein
MRNIILRFLAFGFLGMSGLSLSLIAYSQSLVELTAEKSGQPLENRNSSNPPTTCPIRIQPQPLRLVGMKQYPTLVFSPDSRFLAAADRSGGSGLMLWEVATGKQEHLLPKGWVGEIAFSPDGKTLAVGFTGGDVVLIDLFSRRSTKLSGHTRSINAIAFSPDGQSIASSSADNTVRIWGLDGKNRSVIQGLTKAKFGTAREMAPFTTAVSWNARGWFLLIASPRQVQVWQSPDKMHSVLENADGFSVAKFSPDGNNIATISHDGVRLWDMDGNQLAHWNEDDISSQIINLQFSSDSQNIITSSENGKAILWNLTGKSLSVLKGHQDTLTGTIFSHNNKCVLTNSIDNTVRIWDISGHELAKLPTSFSMVVSPNSQYLATTEDDEIIVWKLE